VERKDGLKGWVSIMYGCNNFCTYCIVPYVRGRERSRLPEDIIREVSDMVAAGYKDITLLGQNVNSYGKDLGLGVDFSDLLSQLSELPGDFVLRFMTSHPKDASKKLFDTMAASPKIAKHIHLPFQAGNDRVLKAMNRNYTSSQYLSLIDYARSVMPDLVLTSDVIVGFPGETDEEFEDTLKLVEQVRYDALFTFIYSPRTGTPAAELPDPATRQEKQVRFDRLLELQNRISQEKHSAYVGKTLRVLIDGLDGDCLTARTDGGRLVRLPGDPGRIGTFQKVRITDSTTWSLVGTLEEAE
jgi:tRNA-2-methylthio-N6-dimethylallyladenosine synthase